MLLRLVILFWTLSNLSGSYPIQSAVFGDGIFVLNHPLSSSLIPELLEFTDHLGFTALLSPQGNFGVAAIDRLQLSNLYTYPDYTGTTLYIWNLNKTLPVEAVTLLDPSYSADVSTEREGPAFAVSPDERFIAIQLENELRILTFPALQFHTAISTYPRLSRNEGLGWSSDSRYVGAIFEMQLVVWDATRDETYVRQLDYLVRASYSYPILKALENGLIIDYFAEQPDITFAFCDWKLIECLSYDYHDGRFAIATQAGSTILTQSQHPASVGVWQFQASGQYELAYTLDLNPRSEPSVFSSTGKFLYLRGNSSPEGTGGEIWDFGSWTRLQEVFNRQPVWLPGDEFFVTMMLPYQSNLLLYRSGQATPLDLIDLSLIPELDRDELRFGEDYHITVDRNGRWSLIDVGWAAVVVPIVYADEAN
jgi:hypothetical protein